MFEIKTARQLYTLLHEALRDDVLTGNEAVTVTVVAGKHSETYEITEHTMLYGIDLNLIAGGTNE